MMVRQIELFVITCDWIIYYNFSKRINYTPNVDEKTTMPMKDITKNILSLVFLLQTKTPYLMQRIPNVILLTKI